MAEDAKVDKKEVKKEEPNLNQVNLDIQAKAVGKHPKFAPHPEPPKEKK